MSAKGAADMRSRWFFEGRLMLALDLSSDTFGPIGAALFVIVLIGYVALIVGALASSLSAPQSGGMKLVWSIFILVAPCIGSLLWFMVGKRAANAA
jgi:hypothetical protein